MDSATQILTIAERRMRQTGYNAVSYRDIAAEIGIRSASLHYHFPKKKDLGTALVRRYAQNFSQALVGATAKNFTAADKISAFVDIYRVELKQNQLVCLCAVLGAEAEGLPQCVSEEVRGFFEENILWLSQQYEILGVNNPESHAKVTLALLSGAMTLSAVNNDHSIFDAAARTIMQMTR